MITKLILLGLLQWLVRGSPVSVNQLDSRTAKSQEIRKYMNASADPCENFYDFVCGNWNRYHPVSDSNPYVDVTYVAAEDFDRKVAKMLTTDDELDTKVERNVKNFYESCLGLATLKQAEYKATLMSIIAEFGQMPALAGDSWEEEADDFDWQKMVAKIFHKYDINIILSPMLLANHNDQTDALFFVNQDFAMEPIFDDIVRKLEKFLDFETEVAEKMAKEIVDFQVILQQASRNDSRDGYQTTVEELHNKCLPELDIKQLITIVHGSIPTDVVFDMNPDYTKTIGEIMKTAPKRTVANFIYYHLLDDFMIELPEPEIELEKMCLAKTERIFADVVSYMFYRTNNLKAKEDELQLMLTTIKSTLQVIVKSQTQLSWLSDDSRAQLLEKIQEMKMETTSYQTNTFDMDYAAYELNNHDYIKNLEKVKSLVNNERTESIKLTDYISLYAPAYIRRINTVVIPVSVLDSDFHWSNLHPNSLNFARLGFIVAHEMLHTFVRHDLFNENADTKRGYAERVKCFYDQYSNYKYEGRSLVQDESQSENMADNGGLILAYEAYRRWYEDSERHEKELDLETLPDLDYNNKQLFFIGFGQTYCSQRYADNPDAPEEFRLFVPLPNIEDFSKQFRCPQGSVINPKDKCYIF